jgi:aldehyde:ferredoxin oxidoreductase
LIHHNTGLDFTSREIWDVANRCYTIERLFNLREGLTRKDDWLVDRYFDEPTPLGLPIAYNKKIDRKKLKGMIDEYYALHKWNENGIPTPELLEELDLVSLVPGKSPGKKEN